ncbi:MAG TPA: iron-siderophore ABC transporter substrate-binding protein [Terrimesophilobacter sp.]|nr:iron-siderophore ABC transporter substrate-binding protein [Terrimesophilobacter sp.]
MRQIRSRTRGAALFAAAISVVLLAGCASGPASPDSGAPSGSDAAFPVTVTSALGDAVIPATPKRVVTIGWGAADTVIALGTTPVGMEAATYGGDEDGYFPWTRDAIEDRGDPLPATFDVYPEIDVEKILSLTPDLILAPQSGVTAEQFSTLSKIAPTVAYPNEAWRTSWTDEISIIGKALGHSAQAASLTETINSTIARAAAAHPEFTGISFAYVYTAEPGQLQLYQAGDPRVDLLSGLGMTLDPAVAAVPISVGTFTSTVGLERADVLNDVDVLLTWFNDAANQKEVEAQPLFAQIPAFARASYVPNVDNQLVMASSMITPLSVPWALDRYVPQLTRAVEDVQK